MNTAVLDHIGRPRHALFVGRGVAEMAALLRGRINQVVALDSSQDVLDWAEGQDFEKHLLRLDDVNPLAAVEGRQFDLVVMEGIISPALFERACSRLVDGGHLIASFEAGAAPHDAVRRSLEDAGLEVMRYELNPRFLRSRFPRAAKTVDDLRLADVGLLRSASHLTRPIKRLVALRDPEHRAGDHIWVARKRPARGPLSLTVGMLTLNEAESVADMIRQIRATVPDARILIVDSSSDRTPDIARSMGVRVVRQLPARGHGPAMERLMYEAAQDTEALIYLDCDFTYPTAMISGIRTLLEEGADVVNASRTARYPKAMPLPNFMANRVMAASVSLVHGLPTTDVHSGMRGYRTSVIRAFSFDGSGDALPLDTLILPARSGYDVVEFPIEYAERVGVSKLAKVRGLLWTYVRIIDAVGRGTRVERNSPRYHVTTPPRGGER